MAAGQQKKRLNVANFTRFNSREQPLAKKKKLESPRLTWNLRPHISLVWDVNKRKAVARREQIGITWRELSHFFKPRPSSTSGLADVFSVPEEIFQLDNLNDVLSYEVWEACLSESERDFLIQFLPNVKDVDEVVQPLLTGENMHFGNPLDNWSACLISGKLHPDAVIHHKRQLKANKNDYYDQIKAYHDGMIKRLLNWKERWESCTDPVKEIVERVWRLTKQHDKCGNGVANHGNSPMPPKPVKTIMPKEQVCDACKDPRKASKYMSYIKITRSQHQLVKNIKSGGDGILSKSLSRVLGDVKGLQLQPYEAFEEEESRRLREHWLQLARKDLPLAFEELCKRRTSKEHSRMSIKQEISEKLTTTMDKDEENDNSQCSETKQVENTISKENHEFLTELVYVTENENSEGNHEEFSPGQKATNLESEENHEPRHDTDNEGSEVSAHQSVDTLENEVSKGSCALSDLDKNDDMVLQQAEDCSEENSGNLGLQQPDNSLPQQQSDTNLRHLGDVCSPSHLHEDLRRIPSLNSHHNALDSEVFDYIVVGDEPKSEADNSLIHKKSLEHFSPAEDENCKNTISMNVRNLEKIPSLNRNPDPNSVSPYQETNGEILNSSGTVSVLSPFLGTLETSTNIMKPQGSDFSAKDSWSEVGIRNSYSGAQECNMYSFADGLSLGGSNRVEGHPASAVSLEGKVLIEEASGVANEATIFHSYASSNPYQNIHLPPLSKGQLLPPYSIQQFNSAKRSNLPGFGQNNGLLQHSIYHNSSQEPKNTYQEQKDVFEQTQSREKELYIQQMANKADFSNGRTITSGRNMAMESQDWLAFTAGNGGLPGHNLFSSELQPRSSWSMIEPPMNAGPRLNEGRNADGSLYSILPEYNKTSHGLFGNIANSDRLAFPSNFTSESVADVGAFPNNSYGFTHGQLNNSRSHEASGSMAPPKVGTAPWVNFPPQNSNFNGFLGKSNMRPWKQ